MLKDLPTLPTDVRTATAVLLHLLPWVAYPCRHLRRRLLATMTTTKHCKQAICKDSTIQLSVVQRSPIPSVVMSCNMHSDLWHFPLTTSLIADRGLSLRFVCPVINSRS